MTENQGFADEVRSTADQAQEIDPAAAPAREPFEQFASDQAQEIDPAGDNPIEPGGLPRTGG